MGPIENTNFINTKTPIETTNFIKETPFIEMKPFHKEDVSSLPTAVNQKNSEEFSNSTNSIVDTSEPKMSPAHSSFHSAASVVSAARVSRVPQHKVWILSFGQSSEKEKLELREFEENLHQKNIEYSWFDKIILCNSSCIEPSFWQMHHTVFGHDPSNIKWVWKPYLILKTLKEIRDWDILIYVDKNISINFELGEKRFQQYLTMVRENPSGMLGFKRE